MWPDGKPHLCEPMAWVRHVLESGTTWIFSGADPSQWPPGCDYAVIEERPPHFRWDVGGDGWVYDAGYARSLGVAQRRAEDAYRECWSDLVEEYEAKAGRSTDDAY